MDSATLVAQIQAESGLDAASTTALGWLNAAYQAAVAGARWRKAEVTIGTTVAGTDTYTLDDASIVELTGLMVGSTPYQRVGTQDIWDLKAGNKSLNVDGVYAPDFTSTGAARVVLYPAPSASGQTISALAAIEPSLLDGTSGTAPIVGAEFHPRLVDVAIALGKARLNADPNARQEYQQGLQQLTQDLQRDKNAEVSGVVRIDMSGF